MGENTGIQWTDSTWNPVVGCERISPGCTHCYAKELHDRRHKAVLAGKAMPEQYAKPFEVVQTRPDRLDMPLHWRRSRRIFVNSMSDLFHADVPDYFIDRVFAVMALAPQHTFQILTKRADRMLAYLNRPGKAADVATTVFKRFTVLREAERRSLAAVKAWPLPNVWLGVSVENQHFANERIPLLLQTPAAVRFISAEPLLGSVDLANLQLGYRDSIHALEGWHDSGYWSGRRYLPRLDWVIVGGESGHGARPCAIEWIESVVQQCRAACVPVFVKQLGAYVVSEQRTAPRHHFSKPNDERLLLAPNGEAWAWRAGLKDKKGGDCAEFPAPLQVREFPEQAVR